MVQHPQAAGQVRGAMGRCATWDEAGVVGRAVVQDGGVLGPIGQRPVMESRRSRPRPSVLTGGGGGRKLEGADRSAINRMLSVGRGVQQ